MTRWIDVSIPLHEGLTVWPGDTPFAFEPQLRIEAGDPCNVSSIKMSSHAGTHVDAPWHFEDEGRRLHEVDTSVFFGSAQLIDLPDVDRVRADDLGPGPLQPRVLLKTRNSQRNEREPFTEDYVSVDEDAAQRLVDEGVRLIGVDYLSVAPFDQVLQETHHILLQNDVFIVEGLRLAAFDAGAYAFVVLPLAIKGADGAPARAFVGIEE